MFLESDSKSVISPNWQRVQNAAGTSILEVKIYTYSATGTFKIEGQIVNFFTSTNTQVLFNVVSFYNSASSATCGNFHPGYSLDYFESLEAILTQLKTKTKSSSGQSFILDKCFRLLIEVMSERA